MKMSAEEYLKTLTEKSVWVFTKQKVSSFDEIIKVTNLFDSIPNRETTNIEEFFRKIIWILMLKLIDIEH